MSLKLNVGCGRHKKDGYINIDIKGSRDCEPDLKCDCRTLPYKKNSIDIIESYHLIEHLIKSEGIEAIRHWFNLLKPGGLLIIECPNLLDTCKDLVSGKLERIDNIYGLQRHDYDYHKFGYTPTTLMNLFTKVGFSKVWESQPKDYHTESEPCMRIEGIK